MVRALDWGSRSREFESHHSDGERACEKTKVFSHALFTKGENTVISFEKEYNAPYPIRERL